MFYYFGGSKTSSQASARSPESTPRARKRSPRTQQNKNESKRQSRVVGGTGAKVLVSTSSVADLSLKTNTGVCKINVTRPS